MVLVLEGKSEMTHTTRPMELLAEHHEERVLSRIDST
jgi:hypothetical protein